MGYKKKKMGLVSDLRNKFFGKVTNHHFEEEYEDGFYVNSSFPVYKIPEMNDFNEIQNPLYYIFMYLKIIGISLFSGKKTFNNCLNVVYPISASSFLSYYFYESLLVEVTMLILSLMIAWCYWETSNISNNPYH